VLAVEDFLEAADGVREETCTPGVPVKTSATLNGWLRKRWILRARRPAACRRGKFVHAENRDDVLQVLVALQHFLHAAGDRVMLLADDLRRERLRELEARGSTAG
jgi:hypothetical protein